MQIHLIRNATMRLTYKGQTLLLDPDLAPKHGRESFTGGAGNPIADLPISPEEAVAGIDAVIVSHLHRDHYDDVAKSALDKAIPLFCRPGDDATIIGDGFTDVRPIEQMITWRDIQISRTPGQHWTNPDWAERLGEVAGFVLQAEGEPTLYWAGDTVLYEPVEAVMDSYKPDVVITHSSGAVLGDSGLLVMDASQTAYLTKAYPDVTVVAVHLEALDHGTSSRGDVRKAGEEAGVSERLLIPADGETLTIGV